MADKEKWGLGASLGLTLASAVGTFAAVAYGRKQGRGYRPVEDVIAEQAYADGYIPGYATHPASTPYRVYIHDPDAKADIQIGWSTGIWFESLTDEINFMYDILSENLDLPMGGKVLAIAHHMKAGRHIEWPSGKRTRRPLVGFNLWGMKGGGAWAKSNPFSTAPTIEYTEANPRLVKDDDKWRWYPTPEACVDNWFNQVMSSYPKAKAELQKKVPDPYQYAWGLAREFSTHGYTYATGTDRPGGPWRFGRHLAKFMQDISSTLIQSRGFVIRDEVAKVEVLTFQDIYDVMCAEGNDVTELWAYANQIKADIDIATCPRVVAWLEGGTP